MRIVGPITERPFQIPALPLTWIAALWLGILGAGLAILMYYYLIHEIGPTRATLVTYLFPVGGVIFLKEQLSWQLVAGTLLIIASLAVVNWKPGKIPAIESNPPNVTTERPSPFQTTEEL
jgi:drug/metabolite transporter (DMT)-like permease